MSSEAISNAHRWDNKKARGYPSSGRSSGFKPIAGVDPTLMVSTNPALRMAVRSSDTRPLDDFFGDLGHDSRDVGVDQQTGCPQVDVTPAVRTSDTARIE